MTYNLYIKGETETISLISKDTPEFIKEVDFKISLNDKSANGHSEHLHHTVIIKGTLSKDTKDQTKEILEWSKKKDEKNVYKNISIEVFEDKTKIRDYYMKDMFCVSYQEFFSEDGGTFVLEMKQKNGRIDTINVD